MRSDDPSRERQRLVRRLAWLVARSSVAASKTLALRSGAAVDEALPRRVVRVRLWSRRTDKRRDVPGELKRVRQSPIPWEFALDSCPRPHRDAKAGVVREPAGQAPEHSSGSRVVTTVLTWDAPTPSRSSGTDPRRWAAPERTDDGFPRAGPRKHRPVPETLGPNRCVALWYTWDRPVIDLRNMTLLRNLADGSGRQRADVFGIV